MKKYKYGVTEEMAKWAIEQDLATEEELMNYNEYDAATLITCYSVHNNKKCIIHSKTYINESGEEVCDSVLGYVNESYETTKAREELEKKNSQNAVDEVISKIFGD